MINADDIIQFWFYEIDPKQRWVKNLDFDRLLSRRFSRLHQLACRSELFTWRQTALGRLAEIIILDQFSRHIYRDQKEAFSQDPLALCLAQHAVAKGDTEQLSAEQKSFLYMPFMHSESIAVHEQAMRLFSEPGLEDNLHFELRHKDIIERFGRYPHRNRILARQSTPEELKFLDQPGSSF